MTEEQETYKYLMESGAYPIPEEKYNVHLFLHRVATAPDTTKVGFLSQEEVGIPRYSLRSLKEFGLISGSIIGNKTFEEYFTKLGEIVSSTSLSKQGFLVRQATTTTRQIADVTKEKKPNKGWFKKKDKSSEEEPQ